MTASPKQTPKYDNPPVVETVIGVQFPELPRFGACHFGLFWKTLDERFSRVEDKPRAGKIAEEFPHKTVIPQGLFVQQSTLPDRVWYVSEDDSDLIQVQPNRFIYNWRRRPKNEERYTSFEDNSKKFSQEFEAFRGFCREQDLEDPIPEYCEVTYVNHLEPKAGETVSDLFGKVFAGLNWRLSDGWLPQPEAATFNRTFVIDDNRGRLYAEASLARVGKEQAELILFKLTAYVKHDPEVTNNLADSLQLAHNWVVNGFASLTDSAIQKDRWERTI